MNTTTTTQAVQIIKELSAQRAEEKLARARSIHQARVYTINRVCDLWQPLVDVIYATKEEYPGVAIELSTPTMHNKREEIYFLKEVSDESLRVIFTFRKDRLFRIQRSAKGGCVNYGEYVASSETVEGLLPALMDILAEIVTPEI